MPDAEVPESFKVLIKEMRSLCLNVELEGHNREVLDVIESRPERTNDDNVLAGLVEDAQKTEREDDDMIGDIAAELSNLISDDLKDGNDGNDLIGGEER